MTVRLTGPVRAVCEDLRDADETVLRWGLELCRRTELGPGAMYPILARLARLGWVQAIPEEGAPPGRPRRTYYRMTELGRAEYARAVAAQAERRSRWMPRREHSP